MSTVNIKLYNLIRKEFKTSDETALEFVQAVTEVVEEKNTELATKKDLLEAKNDILKWFIGIFITLALMIIGLYIKG